MILRRPVLMLSWLAGSVYLAAPAALFAQDAPATPAPATATETAPESYPSEYFGRFSPQTALDMVERIPDFALTETSGDRGLGEASQNLLINGRRVTGKDNDAQTALRQIAAASVERIDIVDGAALGIPGLRGRVANVILRRTPTRVQLSWEGQQRRNIEDQYTTGSLSVTGTIGGADYTLGLSNLGGLRRGGQGPEIVTDAAGLVIVDRFQHDEFHTDDPRLGGTLRRSWADGSTLNLNLSGSHEISSIRQDAVATIISTGAVRDEHLYRRYRDWRVEGGGDYEFPLAGGTLKLAALQAYLHTRFQTSFDITDRTSGAITGTRYTPVFDEGESVLRAEYGWGSGGSWSVSLEGAYNFLDTSAGFEQRDAGGVLQPVTLPGADFFVDEWRGEMLLTHGATLATGLRLQATLGGEFSQIRATTGGDTSRRSFWRPKGSLALTWTASPRLTINAALRRRVGQLSFDDFSAAVDLANGTTTAANGRLVPEQLWRVEGEIARSLGAAGSVSIGGYHEWISDIVDSIPVSPTEEAIGNLPSARRYGITARGTLLLDSIGFHGARIDVRGEFRNSRVTDPVTGEGRRISSDLIRAWSAEFRHDIPGSDIAWGGLIQEEVNGPIYRLDQYFRSQLGLPITQAYVEHKDVFGLTVRFSLRNLLGTYDDIRREVSVDRRDGPLAFAERQRRNIYLIGVLTVRGSF